MNFRLSLLLLILLPVIFAGAGCQPAPEAAVSTITAARDPSPTPMPLPPALTPTVLAPTPTNTRVVVASYTPKPPTDTPTPRPTPTITPTPEATATPEETVLESTGPAVTIDWNDAEGKPTIFQGEDEGFFIWTDGDRIHLRGVTKGSEYTFKGRAAGVGTIVNIDPLAQNIDTDFGDTVGQITFRWTTIGGPEGLDFSFTGDNLLLNLGIEADPEPEPNLVFVGPDKERTGMSIELVR